MATNEDATTTTTGGSRRGWTHDLRSRFGVLGELLAFFWKVRLWWLIPMVVALIVFIVVFVLLASTPAGPLIYSIH